MIQMKIIVNMIEEYNMNNNLKYPIIAVDYDETLTTDNKYPEAGTPNMLAIHYCKEYKNRGGLLLLFTCRSGRPLTKALLSLSEHGLTFDAVNKNVQEQLDYWNETAPDTEISPKPFAHMYIDDRAFPNQDGKLNWGLIGTEMLKTK